MKYFCIACAFTLFSYSVLGQDYQAFGNDHLAINKTGMHILGAWSAINIISGGIGWKTAQGENKYFHQMNLLWNTINAGIAIGALVGIHHTNYATMENAEIMSDQLKSQNLFLINAGLDLLYIGGGIFMRDLANRKENQKDRLKGFGKSVILQGGFLLIFDGAFYVLQKNHRVDFLDHLSINITDLGGSFGYAFTF